MGINFPASPVNGQVFAIPNPYGTGPLYRYLASKNVWQKAAGTASRANKFVNPCMQISQERGSTTSAIANGGVACDQWNVGYVGPSAIQAARTLVSPGPTPNGNPVLGCYIGTAKPVLAGGDYFAVGQPIEGNRLVDLCWGTANAKFAVLRFWVWVKIAGTYVASIRNGAMDRSWIGPFTISAAEAGTWVMRSFSVPGDITGTWPVDNSMGITFNVAFAAGTGLHGVAGWQAGNKFGIAGIGNAAATVDWNIFVGDFGLYADPLMTGVAPEFQASDPIDDMEDCLRYWYKIIWGRGVTGSATLAYIQGNHPVPMRSAPAYALVGSGLRLHDGAYAGPITSINTVHASYSEGFYVSFNAAAGTMLGGRICNILADASVANYVACSARM